MSLGQHIFVSLLGHIWDFAKEVHERRRLAHMTLEQLEKWRTEEFVKLHKIMALRHNADFSPGVRSLWPMSCCLRKLIRLPPLP
jgi:hypothetical protein